MKRILIRKCLAIGWYPGDAVWAADGPLVLDVCPGNAVARLADLLGDDLGDPPGGANLSEGQLGVEDQRTEQRPE
jgi:hypothetical protein